MASGIIFHYTSAGSLPSIINENQKSTIWASGIDYLNDHSELFTGIELVSDLLNNEPDAFELDETALNYLIRNFADETLSSFRDRYYVACFSSTTGMVDQWRGYGENGGGFAIGFARNTVEKILAEYSNISTVECVYNYKDQREKLLLAVRKAHELFLKFEESNIELYNRNDSSHMYHFSLLTALQKQLLSIKHNAYQQEREWRIIFRDPGNGPYGFSKPLKKEIHFRAGPFGLTPFVELDLPEVRALIVGPSEHQSQNTSSAKLLLRNRGYSNLADSIVQAETIPFRG